MKTLIYSLVLTSAFTCCVGVDVANIELLPQRLEITDYPSQLKIGESYQLKAIKIDSVGSPHMVNPIWTSSDETIASVDGQIVNGIAEGIIQLQARYNDLTTTVEIMVTQNETLSGNLLERTGILMGRSGYDITGGFRIFKDGDLDKVYLEFTDAMIDDNVPGPYYYLSNTTNSVTGGIMLGVAEDGDSIWELPSDVSVNTYNVVIVWCQPFGVTLGFGEFEN